jgi:phenylalanine-4-hydroxylase
VGESYHCFDSKVKKIPLSLQCIETDYDITKPQPQLFYAESFEHLISVINEFSKSMSYKKGGLDALQVAAESKTVNTVAFDGDLSVSGILERVLLNRKDNSVIFLKFSGPSQLSFKHKQIKGHGAKKHKMGYSTPIGKLQDGRLLSELSGKDQKALGLVKNKKVKLVFESGIELQGKVTLVQKNKSKIQVITFSNCTIKYGKEFLYKPSFGSFDLICVDQVKSVFGGAADRSQYIKETVGIKNKTRPQKSNSPGQSPVLNKIYAKIKKLRDLKLEKELDIHSLYQSLNVKFPEDWLSRLELLELIERAENKSSYLNQIKEDLLSDLSKLQKKSMKYKDLIGRGLDILGL